MQGEILIIPRESALAAGQEFFDALHAFQYGGGDKSDEGFEEMRRLTQKGTDPDNPSLEE